MKQVDKNYSNKFRFYFLLNKLSSSFLILLGATLVIGLFMLFYIRMNPSWLNPGRECGIIPTRCLKEIEIKLNLMNQIFISMVITGIVGIIISIPIMLMLSKRLSILQSTHINQAYLDHKNFMNFQRESNKTIKPPKYI